jgi:hypothetical protein
MLYTNRKAIQLHGIDHSAGFFNHPVISTRNKYLPVNPASSNHYLSQLAER